MPLLISTDMSSELVKSIEFQQCGMCNQQSLKSACAYAQSDQNLSSSLEYYISVKLLTGHNLEFPSFERGAAQARLSLH